VAAFTARLRHTVDLDALRHDLLGVTEDAFQPAHVSMWLAPMVTGEQDRAALVEGAYRWREPGMAVTTSLWRWVIVSVRKATGVATGRNWSDAQSEVGNRWICTPS
jgi:hypothetical protein